MKMTWKSSVLIMVVLGLMVPQIKCATVVAILNGTLLNLIKANMPVALLANLPVNLGAMLISSANSLLSGQNSIQIDIGNYTIPNTNGVYIYYSMVVPITNPLKSIPINTNFFSTIISSLFSFLG
jgi:hypothetical protein